MAVDGNKTRQLIESIEDLFGSVAGSLPVGAQDALRSAVFGKAFDEIRRLIDESRPPVMMLVGRTGHGKSSLINALAGKHVAETGEVRSTTSRSESFDVHFAERYATWRVIDTRGFFELAPPEGAPDESSQDALLRDIRKYGPDVLFHVASAPEVRGMSEDVEFFGKIQAAIRRTEGIEAPTVVTLTKVDAFVGPRWRPPEEYPRLAGAITDAVGSTVEEMCHAESSRPIDPSAPMRGVLMPQGAYEAVIPVCTYTDGEGPCYWNIDTLADFVARRIPEEALLDFAQALKRKTHLRRISSALIRRFATIAGGVGATPIPVADIAVLTPLQILMIAVIGGLSCRDVSKDTAFEYLAASGANLAVATGLRWAAQELVKLIPVLGPVISGGVASAGTYGIGKSAELYFFSGEFGSPEEFSREWKEEAEQ